MNETFMGLLGLCLLIPLPIGLALFIFLRASRRGEPIDPNQRLAF